MPKLDELKARLSFAEKMLFASLAIIFALVGWMSGNFDNSNAWLLAGAFAVLLFSTVFCVLSYRYIKRLIEEIGEC
jgi:hypothetical protein